MEWLAEAKRCTEGIVSDSTEVRIAKLKMATVPNETCLAEVKKKKTNTGNTDVYRPIISGTCVFSCAFDIDYYFIN